MRCTLANWRSGLWSWDNGGGGDPTGACCTGSDCTTGTEADCIAGGGAWQGDGSDCGSTSCGGGGDPTGACCTGSDCTTGTEADCLAGGGAWQGDGSDCGSTSCGGGGGDPADALVIGAAVQTGTQVGGSAADLDVSDNSYLSVDADQSGSRYTCEVDVSLISEYTTASRIDVRTEVGASASGAKTRIFIYNVSSGSWTRIISYNQSTADTVREANDISSPSNYVDPATGEIRVRVFSQKRNGDFVVDIDEVNVTVAP